MDNPALKLHVKPPSQKKSAKRHLPLLNTDLEIGYNRHRSWAAKVLYARSTTELKAAPSRALPERHGCPWDAVWTRYASFSAPFPPRCFNGFVPLQAIMLIRTAPTGKTAPRLINDLLDHDPRNVFKHGRNLLVDPGRKYTFGRGPALSARKDRLDCRHKLMRKEPQTNAPRVGEEPDLSTEYKVAAYCTACLHHFDITANFWRRNDRKTPCSLSDEFNPLHHLQLARSQTAKEHKKEYGVNKYDQLIEAHRFVCSGPECPLQLDIKISPPRLNHIMLAYILDPVKLDVRGQREIKNDPERYQGMSPIKPLQALGYLRQYLVDAKGAKSKTELKRIARRNKKYMLTFADECDELFEYLDFKPIEEASPEPEVSIGGTFF